MSAWKTAGKKGQKLRRKLGMTQSGGSMEVSQLSLRYNQCIRLMF